MWKEDFKKIFKEKRQINTELFTELNEFLFDNRSYIRIMDNENICRFITNLYICRNQNIVLIKDNEIIDNSLLYRFVTYDPLISQYDILYFAILNEDKQKIFYSYLDNILNLKFYINAEDFSLELKKLRVDACAYLIKEDYDNLLAFISFLSQSHVAYVKRITEELFSFYYEKNIDRSQLYELRLKNKRYYYKMLFNEFENEG